MEKKLRWYVDIVLNPNTEQVAKSDLAVSVQLKLQSHLNADDTEGVSTELLHRAQGHDNLPALRLIAVSASALGAALDVIVKSDLLHPSFAPPGNKGLVLHHGLIWQ